MSDRTERLAATLRHDPAFREGYLTSFLGSLSNRFPEVAAAIEQRINANEGTLGLSEVRTDTDGRVGG